MTQAANTYEELSCQELVELVTDYLEGALPEELHTRFEEHIAGCDGCRAYLAQMRTARKLTHTLADEPLPASLERELLDAFRNWRRL